MIAMARPVVVVVDAEDASRQTLTRELEGRYGADYRDTGDTEREPADALFVLIGAQPFTDWLPETVGRDQWGFILTGPDLAERWTLQREPYLLETSTPGVFAAGDVRHGSVKRVASAVGDGSIAIRLAHDYLA
jgi:thioredoxin reductase (NADPH)